MIRIFNQFIKFGIVGLSNTFISYGVYAGLVYLGLYYLIASIISFVVSVLNSFYWNHKYVFSVKDNEHRHFWKSLIKTFIAYGFTGLLLNNIFLYIAVDFFKLSKYLAPIIILIITVPINFFINKFWAFKVKEKIIE
jgi:putative flippase GtrA